MAENKILFKNVIESMKNIKHTIMNLKRGVIVSKNYFQETNY